ncbi:MAG: hypothetical protein SOI44_04150 [Lactimicrobium sp.]|uniref:hypothetical protein n=1 Tax=Lactimicrobium sp. TaxID=2563780 RepID=UPI002F35048E
MKIEMKEENFECLHSVFEIVEPGVLKAIKTEKIPEDDTNSLVIVKGLQFKNAVIEYDCMSELAKDAPEYARGFIGIGWHINEKRCEFEGFYLRPTNGRGCTDPYRQAHACQYFAYPGYTWSYLREFGFTGYEAPISSIALGEWAHVKAEIVNESAKFYVNGKLVLSLDGNLLHRPIKGDFGFNTHIGTESWFKNLEVTVLD